MSPFEWQRPASLAEAMALLGPDDPSVRPLSGGTALMLMMKAGVFRPTRLVCLQGIAADHAGIVETASGELHIGALATLAALEHSPLVARHSPVLREAMTRLANVRVRNVARVGGALAHGDPHMDLPPVLAALRARAVVAGPVGTREVAVEDLYAGYYETVLAPDELITAVIVPPAGGRRAAYAKVTTRASHDWPALGIAVSVLVTDGVVRDASVVVGAATEKVIRLTATERALAGAGIDASSLQRAGEAAAAEAPVVADAQGSASYKRELLRVHLGRAVGRALADDVG